MVERSEAIGSGESPRRLRRHSRLCWLCRGVAQARAAETGGALPRHYRAAPGGTLQAFQALPLRG